MADSSSSNQERGTRNPSDRRESIRRFVAILVHACKCDRVNCQPCCRKMKYAVEHLKNCTKRPSGSCPVCKAFVGVCIYHAGQCRQGDCPVVFCQQIRRKLAQQRAQLEETRRAKRELEEE